MEWDGKIGWSFIIVATLAVLQCVQWINTSSAGVDRRVAIIENSLAYISPRIERIEQKIDALRK